MKHLSAFALLLIGIGILSVRLWLVILLIPISFVCWCVQEGLRQPKFSVDNKGELHSKGFELNS